MSKTRLVMIKMCRKESCNSKLVGNKNERQNLSKRRFLIKFYTKMKQHLILTKL